MSGKVVVFPDFEFVCLYDAKKRFIVVNIHGDLRLFVVEVCLLQAHSRGGGVEVVAVPPRHI